MTRGGEWAPRAEATGKAFSLDSCCGWSLGSHHGYLSPPDPFSGGSSGGQERKQERWGGEPRRLLPSAAGEGGREEGRGKEINTCSMRSAKAEPCSERSNNPALAAQLLSDHAGAEMRICPTPKARVFSAAMGTFKGGQKNPKKGEETHRHVFPAVHFPSGHHL